MRLIVLAATALALTGCTSVPVTQTAANNDACLRASVRPSIAKLPVTAADMPVSPTKCRSMGSTWSGVGINGRQAMNQNGEGMPYQSHP